ncbi:unnamed protein product [Paramecium octaurelia]|uniref:Uncharacterized protein n=1 Tax=Paramecium octaurelia TaxID=43137 RepID=A0A8S1VKQ0_PAROT|nr:unnamed protein product [Paramecium octaurelia]
MADCLIRAFLDNGGPCFKNSIHWRFQIQRQGNRDGFTVQEIDVLRHSLFENTDYQNRGTEKILKVFRFDIFWNNKFYLNCIISVQKVGFIKKFKMYIQAKLIIYKWNKFPKKYPFVIGVGDTMEVLRFLNDGLDFLHNVLITQILIRQS